MSDVALYFPYVNLPGDAWVKAAALHWPQLGRIHPHGYPDLMDSDTVKRLRDELGFVVDVRTSNMSTGPVDALFYAFLDRYKDELIPQYGAEALGVESLDPDHVYSDRLPLDPRLQKFYPSKMSYRLTEELMRVGLIVPRNYSWRRESAGRVVHVHYSAMHRRLAGVYLAVLADVVAQENRMTPLTDQPLICAAASGWTIEAMAQILLSDETETATQERVDYSNAFVVLALQTVLPRNLAEIPVERIIEARQRLLPELMRYRAFLDSLAMDFIEISEVRDPEVRAAKLRNHVGSQIAQPIETMERELGRLGLQPMRAVLSLQTLAPPTALGLLANAVHAPTLVTSAGVVAGCLVGAANGALDQRRQVLASHPSGYLLNLRNELGPSDAVAQIRSAVRRAAPRRRHR
ncbi:DUF6236 family protein [Streptomyces mirabilis]|uniref:DUF6236 family protein n=1 Tax=Streptomyces mirabilis TaxID=68239 RepID=UPI003683DF6C